MASKAKGNDHNCCCGGCGRPPVGQQIPGYPAQLTQIYCMSCIPLQLCAQYQCPGDYPPGPCSGHWALMNNTNSCRGLIAYNNYACTIGVNGVPIDLTLTLFADVIYGTCQICFSSVKLGIENQCVLVDDWLRTKLGTPCGTCADCNPDSEIPGDSVPILVFDCGNGCTLKIWHANNVSVKKQPLMGICRDPCKDLAPNTIDPYPPDCGGPCSGCDCLCQGAKLFIARQGVGLGIEDLTFCNNSYVNFDGSWRINLAPGPTGCCELHLENIGTLRPSGKIPPVPIGQLSLNPCPNPTARWDFLDVSDPYKPALVSVYFDCVACNGNPVSIGHNVPCCDVPIPPVLHGELIFSPPCLSPSLGAVALSIPIFFDPNNSWWYGEWNNPDTHTPPYTEIIQVKVTLSCGADHVGIRLQINALGIDVTLPVPYEQSCDPVDYTVTANGTFHGPECGNVIPGSTPWSATLTVTA